MLLFERSQIVNEPLKFWAWYPVPIRTLKFHSELGVKVCKTEWVIFKTVYKTIKIRSGIYYGSEYSHVYPAGDGTKENKNESQKKACDEVIP